MDYYEIKHDIAANQESGVQKISLDNQLLCSPVCFSLLESICIIIQIRGFRSSVRSLSALM